jgi:hypothetical protein
MHGAAMSCAAMHGAAMGASHFIRTTSPASEAAR